MASNYKQDVVSCQLCPNPVEHHCNLCHVDLCTTCIPKHLADKTKRHEIVEFINKKEGYVLPECISHRKHRCEVFCKHCHVPVCVLCVTSTHKMHDIIDIWKVIKKKKQRIIDDLTELEENIVPAYSGVKAGLASAEFDKVLSAIQDHEDYICEIIRAIGSEYRKQVTKMKDTFEQENREIQSSAENTESQVNAMITQCKNLLESADGAPIINYKSVNRQFKDRSHLLQPTCPKYSPGMIEESELLGLFGQFQIKDIVTSPFLDGNPENLDILWEDSVEENIPARNYVDSGFPIDRVSSGEGYHPGYAPGNLPYTFTGQDDQNMNMFEQYSFSYGYHRGHPKKN